MATESSPKPNTITWTEIPCTDLTRATDFYKAVFGWTINPMPSGSIATGCPNGGEPSVAMFSHETTQGSFVRVEPENLLSPAKHPDNPAKGRIAVRVTISVDSVDEKAKEVVKAGGKIYQEKVEIPGNMGFLVYFTDPERNVMGLWSAK